MEWGIGKHGGYTNAKQFRGARKVLRNLKSIAGRVMLPDHVKVDEILVECLDQASVHKVHRRA